MKQSFLIIFFLSFACVAIAQGGAIKGSIQSINQSPLQGITITLQGTKWSTITDHDGVFYFQNIKPGDYFIEASGIGYSAKSQSITVVDASLVTVNFQLNEKANILQEVIVKSYQRMPKASTASVTRLNVPLKDLPQNIQVIDRITLDEQQLFTVDQAFKNVAGVNAANIYGAFYVRGFETYSTSFLTNGLKGSPYPEGVMPLLGNIERVEVIHGPAAILYGEGALGGNINMVTKQPKKTTSFNASVGRGGFDMTRIMTDVTGSINKKKSVYFLAGGAFQNGGRFTKNFKNRNVQLYGSLKWDAGARTSVQLNTNFLSDNSTSNWQPDVPVMDDIPLFSLPADFTYLANDARYQGNSYQLQLDVNHSISDQWKANLLFGWSEGRSHRKQYYLNWDYNPTTTALARGYSMQKVYTPTGTINPYVSGSFKLAGMKHKIATGADLTFNRSNYPVGIKYYQADSFYINAPAYEPAKAPTYHPWSSRTEKFIYNTAAAYFQDLIEITSKLKVLVGIRFTNYHRSYYADDDNLEPIYDEKPENTQAFTPRAGLVYQPIESTSFYVDYNRGFAPQYSNYRDVGGPFDPETSHQYEIGYKGDYFNHTLKTTVAAYRTTKENVLVYYTDPSLPRGYGYKPLQEVVSKGIEISVTGTVAKGFYVITNYSFNETKIAKSADPEQVGKGFYNAPSNNANGWLSYNFSDRMLKGLNLGFGLSYIGKRNTYFGFVPEYMIADAMLAYAYKRYRLQLNGNNLFNKHYAQAGGYVSYAPGAPRNFMVTASYSLK